MSAVTAYPALFAIRDPLIAILSMLRQKRVALVREFDELLRAHRRNIVRTQESLHCSGNVSCSGWTRKIGIYKDHPTVVNAVWRLCQDVSRSARFYVYTKTDMKDDIELMAEINRRFDNLRETIRIDWLDSMTFEDGFTYPTSVSSNIVVAAVADNVEPTHPVHDQVWSLAKVFRIVMIHEGADFTIHDWCR